MKENRFKTNDPRKMLGMYLAVDARKTWKEAFVDEYTGETQEIERSELIMERGTLLDADNVAKLQFSIQAEELSEVEVSDVQRSAKPMGPGWFKPWKVTVTLGTKTIVLLLYARSLEGAVAIGGEYVERNYEGGYTFAAVQGFKDCIFIKREFKEETGEDVFGGEVKEIERAFYLAEVSVIWIWDEWTTDRLFVVLAKDVEELRGLVEDWVKDYAKRERKRMEEQDDTTSDSYKRLGCDFELSVKSATKIPCNATVPMELSKDYYESLEEEAKEK